MSQKTLYSFVCRLSVVASVALLFSSSTWAADSCRRVFDPEKVSRFDANFENLSLSSPEIEAKFLIPNKKTYRKLKDLIGREIVLSDIKGKPVRFMFQMNKEHVYEDTNFDTKQLSLLGKRGMLRQRVRYDRKPGDRDYKFAKAVFQAKNGPSENSGMSAAVFARNEIRGVEFKRLGKFLKSRDERLSERSDDEAVRFAREYSESEKNFKPVLFIKDKRFFMSLKPVGPVNPGVPWFYVSLDNVKYTRLIGAQKVSARLELEAELNDDLTLDSPKNAKSKLKLMDELSRFLAEEFDLTASPESKYEAGMALTAP
jgi:hypothetical protein